MLYNNEHDGLNTISTIITTTNHIYIGAVYIMSGLIGGSIGFGLSIILIFNILNKRRPNYS